MQTEVGSSKLEAGSDGGKPWYKSRTMWGLMILVPATIAQNTPTALGAEARPASSGPGSASPLRMSLPANSQADDPTSLMEVQRSQPKQYRPTHRSKATRTLTPPAA